MRSSVEGLREMGEKCAATIVRVAAENIWAEKLPRPRFFDYCAGVIGSVH